MAINLSTRYMAELRKGVNKPNVVVEIMLDSGSVRYGYHACAAGTVDFLADGKSFADGAIMAMGGAELPQIIPILKSVSSLQNKLDTRSGYSTRGLLTAVLSGRENFKWLLQDEYLKNRRTVRRDGFIADGFVYTDYASTFSGKIQDWSLKGDELTLSISDDLIGASAKIPVENTAKTQYLDYREKHPVDIMLDILIERLGIDAALIDVAAFASERDMWLGGWSFSRVITEPKEANEYLNELQIETNSFVIHDGDKINYKVFAPPVPGQMVEHWSDDFHILDGSLSVRSGYRDNFFNRVVVYLDYDESGADREENYETAVIAADASSQSASEWSEVKTKVIKSRWIRTLAYTDAVNITGVKIYHVSRANGIGTGILSYDSPNGTLRWAAPGGAFGEPVKISADGRYQVFDSDKKRYARVVVVAAGLPVQGTTDNITISALHGEAMASTLAGKLLTRYRDPVATLSLDVDINNCAHDSQFIKPTDLKDITTAEAFKKGGGQWSAERVMLTSVRPDFSSNRVSIEAIETKMYRRYGFISPAGYPDYPGATASQREYGFIGDGANKVDASGSDGYAIW